MIMNNFLKQCLHSFKKTFNYRIILLYLCLGAFIFTVNRSEYSYLELAIHAFSHPFVMGIFLIPTVVYSTLFFYDKYILNYNYVTRVNRNYDLKKDCIIINIYFVLNIIFYFFVFVLIFTNLFANRNYIIGNDTFYNVSNIFLLLLRFFENILFLFSVSIYTLDIKTKKFNYKIIILVLLISSFLGFIPNLIIKFFPSYYISSYHLFPNFNIDILYSSIYIFIILLCSIVEFEWNWKKDLL